MSNCSIIIPAFNQAALTQQCVGAVLRTVATEVEIVVVDDASTETMPVFDPRVRVIRHETNTGFATACNDGASAARGDLLVFLNNDTIPHPGWLDALVDYAGSHPQAGMIGSKLLDVTGNIQHAGVKICQDRYPRHVYIGYPGDHPAVNRPRRVQIVTAACALVRRSAFQQVGGFDAAYRNGFDDVELCLRLAELGHEIHYCPSSVVTHLESFSEGRFQDAMWNADLYRQRWFGRVCPDALPFYLQDDLLRLGYDAQHPTGLTVSPELKYRRLRRAVLETVWRATPPGARVLVVSKGDRGLLEINGRVAGHFPQSDTGGYAGYHFPGSAAVVAHLEQLRRQGAQYFVIPKTSYWWLGYYQEFHAYLKSTCRQITDLDGPCVVFDLGASDSTGVANVFPVSDDQSDPKLRRQILELVQLAIPAGSCVLVAGQGNNDLFQFDDLCTRFFPKSDSAVSAGYPFADSAEAIAHLNQLRQEGAQYLIFPANALWWLDLYADFRRYLETQGSLVAHEAEACVIYSLQRLRWIRPAAPKRVTAILATHNEEKCIAACLEHHIGQGVQVYLIDNGSTDRTVAIAERYRDRGVVEIDHLPFEGVFRQNQIDSYRAKVASTLDTDWVMNIDADEFRFVPREGWTLAEAFAVVESAGYNAVNFLEFVFLPTQESPDHDHPRFQETMRWYYLFLQLCPFRITAWKRQPGAVQVNPHRISFPGMRLCPEFFCMKHYQFLSADHAAQKYGSRRHAPSELSAGEHGGSKGWREQYSGWSFPLPAAADMKTHCEGADWDVSAPRARHYLEEVLERGK